MWLDDAPAIAALKDDEKLKQKTVCKSNVGHCSRISTHMNRYVHKH